MDPLVKGLEAIGGKPRLFAVRTPETLEWSTTLPPSGGGVFEGERYAFYALKPSGNGTLRLRGNIQARPLLAVLMSVALWMLFPLFAAGAARHFAGPQDDKGDLNARWKRWRQALCWATAIGAFATLSFQAEVLRLAALFLPPLPTYVFSISSLQIPLGFLYFYWASAAWHVAGPTAPPFLSKAMLKTLGAGIGFLLLYSMVFVNVGSQDPFSGVGRMSGTFVALLGMFFVGTWFWLDEKTKKAASEITLPPPIPPSEADRHAMLREFEAKAGSPEEALEGEKVLTEASHQMRPFLEAFRALTPEEKSWVTMSHQLAFQKSGRMGLPVLRVLLICILSIIWGTART